MLNIYVRDGAIADVPRHRNLGYIPSSLTAFHHQAITFSHMPLDVAYTFLSSIQYLLLQTLILAPIIEYELKLTVFTIDQSNMVNNCTSQNQGQNICILQ